MKNEINSLKNSFKEIKKLGYIKAINNYSSGGGLTLEKLLNIQPNNLCSPDYKGIELKTINQYWEKNINLFCCTPTSDYKISTMKWIAEKYGYPDRKFKNLRIFNGKISAVELNKVGSKYFFKLKIDYTDRKIILEIYNSSKILINNEIFWNFQCVKEKLEKKLQYMALIYLDKKYKKNEQYCRYNRIKIYKIKNFDTFLKLIENGIIKVNFSTGYNKISDDIIKFHDHGTKFYINEKDILKLFKKVST